MKIDVVLNPAEIDLLPQRDLRETTVIVFDVLRATSSMITGLAHGVAEIFPARTIEEALEMKTRLPRAKLGGERNGDKIDGFDIGNSPLEYRNVTGAQIITTTTNGTIALRACEHARLVLVGALLNMNALVDFLQQSSPPEVLLICAGTFREVAMEDVLAAGMLCSCGFASEPTDSAQVAAAVYREHRGNILEAVRGARNGRALVAKSRGEEVEWCVQISKFDVIGALASGVIRALET